MILVEATWGLGEGVVSGIVTPDSYTVDKMSLQLMEEFISQKKLMVVRNACLKGVEKLEVSEEKRGQRVLSGEELKELVNLALKLEEFFGMPQDVEWAIEGNSLLILQSRPITTLSS
jgi:pyruvate, water dikinase